MSSCGGHRPGRMETEASKCQVQSAEERVDSLIRRLCGLAPEMVGSPLKLIKQKVKIVWGQTEIRENIFMSLGKRKAF